MFIDTSSRVFIQKEFHILTVIIQLHIKRDVYTYHAIDILGSR